MPVSVSAPTAFRRLGPPLRALVSLVVKGERRRLGEIAVVLADDPRLRELNQQWRGIDRATDVISFAYDEHEPDAATRPVAGDLVVSLDRVDEQAKRYRVTRGAELARLVVHGTLHLAGHDHHRLAERRTMRAREDAILRGSGVLARKLEAAMRAAALAGLLLLSLPVSRAAADAPAPDDLRAALAAADTVQVSSFVLDWRDSTQAGERKLVSLRRRIAFAPAKPGWAKRLAPVLIPAGAVASKDACPVLAPAHAGPGPWLASVVWASRSGRGQAIVDLADSCAYVVAAGRDPVSLALGERVDDLYAMLREALPSDTTLAHASVASFAAAAPADTALPAIDDAVAVDALPVRLSSTAPVYPDSARAAHVQGTVTLKALIDREGRVRDVRVIQGIPMLDAAAMAAVRLWRFEPARFRNRPVAVWVAVPIAFTIH